MARRVHRWERRLASVSTNRVARPFEWGTDWLADEPLPPGNPRPRPAGTGVSDSRAQRAVLRRDSAGRRRAHGRHAHFTSALRTPPSPRTTPFARATSESVAARPQARGACDGAVELRRRGARRAVPAAQPLRRLRASPQPALSRPAHPARVRARRLRSQLQSRAHRRRAPGRRCSTCGAPIAWCAGAGRASGSSAPASARASRC